MESNFYLLLELGHFSLAYTEIEQRFTKMETMIKSKTVVSIYHNRKKGIPLFIGAP